MLDVANLAHGAFYMLGGYLAYTVVGGSSSACFRCSLDFWIALVVVPLAMGAIGFALAVTLLRPLRGKHLDQPYPAYRLFLIAFGAALAIALWLVQERTRLGALIRAGVADSEMLAVLG